MSGGKGGSQTSQVEIPSWIQQPSIRNMARAESLQKVGYQPYMGPDVAGFTSPQNQAMQANIDAASAFGLVDPGMQATDGMPQTSQFGGVEGYSSYPMYQQAVNQLESERPGQARQYNNLFVDPMSASNYQPGNTGDNTGGNTGGSSGGSGNNGGDYDDNFNPANYSIFDTNPYGTQLDMGYGTQLDTAQETPADGGYANPDFDPSNYITATQLQEALAGFSQPDLSNYAQMGDLYDDSQLRNDINSRFTGLPDYQAPDLSNYAQRSELYDDSQLRNDINSRFSSFSPTNPSPYDDTDIRDLISGNTAAIGGNTTSIGNLPNYQAPDLSNYAQMGDLFDDTQLRQDINSRFSNFKPDGISPYDDSNIRDLISGNTAAIGNIPSYQAPDLSNYAQMGDLYDDSQLRQDINSRFTNFNPNVDLSGYATNESVANQFNNFKPTGPSPYDDSNIRDLISGNTNAIGQMSNYTAPDLSNYAQMSDLANYAQTSDLYNDSQLRADINSRFSALPSYQAPDLSNYATNASVNTALSNFNPNIDLSNYARISQLYDDSALRNDINARFANIPGLLSGGNDPLYTDPGLGNPTPTPAPAPKLIKR